MSHDWFFGALVTTLLVSGSFGVQPYAGPTHGSLMSGSRDAQARAELDQLVAEIETQGSGQVLVVECNGAYGYATIQGAIEAAADGDVVVVLPNTCEDQAYIENINFLGKSITVLSTDPADPEVVAATIIDGSGATEDDEEGSVVTFNHGEGLPSVLEGLTLRGGIGLARYAHGYRYGGGIVCLSSSPAIRKCIIADNSTGFGGGISCADESSPLISNCTFSSNTAASGGGIGCDHGSSPTISDCRISDNTANAGYGGGGGGVYCTSNSKPTIRNCVITNNVTRADYPRTDRLPPPRLGGGIAIHQSSPTVENCIIAGNISDEVGGGVGCTEGGRPSFSNCLISGNTAMIGGAISCWEGQGPVTLTNCTIVGNAATYLGGAISCKSYIYTSIHNCLLWGNTALYAPEIWLGWQSVTRVAFSDVEGGQAGVMVGSIDVLDWGPGNVDADPLFLDADGPDDDPDTWEDNDYHLSTNSPCLDAGDPAFLPAEGEADLDGEGRTFNGRVDIGADEYHDCNGNASPDSHDVMAGISEDCTANGIPDECEPDCNANDVADSCDIAADTAEDCPGSGNGIPDECESDCNGNGQADSCDIARGSSPDCNLNGIPDECDLALSGHEDCNANGRLDECEPGGEEDCNANGVSDFCDIAGGTSGDFDDNGIPDECPPDPTIYVEQRNCPAKGTGIITDPFCRIQDALDQADSGDVILVADGVYTGERNKNLDFQGKTITLRSRGGPDNCVIDAEGDGRGFYFHSFETVDSMVDGFAIRNGRAGQGAGIYCYESSPGIHNCTISNNTAHYGAGICCWNNSRPTINQCTITNNWTDYGHGPGIACLYGSDAMITNSTVSGHLASSSAIYCVASSPTISGSTVADNVGGGFVCYCGGSDCSEAASPTIRDCVFTGNGPGQAISCYRDCDATIADCFIVGNTGGGISCTDNELTINNCLISENTAWQGGGIDCWRHARPMIRNCTIAGNWATSSGGGIYTQYGDELTIINCTIAGNKSEQGGGIKCYRSSPTIRNCILWGNEAAAGPEIYLATAYSELTVAYTDVEGGADGVFVEAGSKLHWVAGNLSEDPVFLDPGGGDFHLARSSPCVDAGDPDFVPAPGEMDLDGEHRVQHCRVDMGSDETPFFADCNGNDRPDACEAVSGAVEDCSGNLVPDACEEDCNGNSTADSCDIAGGTSADCNNNGVPDGCGPCICGDLDEDCDVDLSDFAEFILCLDLCSPAPPECDEQTFKCSDMNADACVDLQDLATLEALYGHETSATVPNCTVP